MRPSSLIPLAGLAVILAGCGSSNKTAQAPPTPPPPGPPSVTPPAPPKTPSAATKGDPAAGKKVFQANCVGCHGPNGQGVMAKTPNFTNAAWWSKQTDADLLNTIHNGQDGMPAWKGKLSEQQMRDALAYEHTFAKK